MNIILVEANSVVMAFSTSSFGSIAPNKKGTNCPNSPTVLPIRRKKVNFAVAFNALVSLTVLCLTKQTPVIPTTTVNM